MGIALLRQVNMENGSRECFYPRINTKGRQRLFKTKKTMSQNRVIISKTKGEYRVIGAALGLHPLLVEGGLRAWV